MTSVRYTLGVSVCLFLLLGGSVQANWSETFAGGQFDLPTWQFQAYPQIVGTLQGAVQTDPDGNGYLALTETTPPDVGGAGFGMALASDEPFADVRVGAVVNVNGDAAHSYHALGARINYFIDDGMITGIPGIVASGYIMLIHWEDGPANLRIEVRKFVNLNQEIMKTLTEVPVPGLDNARSYYAELDVVGANPVYVTGRLYTGRGGALVARTPVLIDTEATDAWENPAVYDAPFPGGVSIVFGANQVLSRPGFYCTFDDISSQSDGPAAVARCPADGAVNVPANAVLRWAEAGFATSRQVWFGPKGAMQQVQPAPEDAEYAPGSLEPGRTYEWRVDEIGPAGTITGPTLTFTVGDSLAVEDFESYADDTQIASAWVDNIPDFDYVFREASTVLQGTQSMRFVYQNQYQPFVTETTRVFDTPQDWTARDGGRLSLAFRGEPNNVAQRFYVRVEDNSGTSATVVQPFHYAVQSMFWRHWDIALSEFGEGGVDLGAVAKLTIGVGDGNASAQEQGDSDVIYIDDIRLLPPADSSGN